VGNISEISTGDVINAVEVCIIEKADINASTLVALQNGIEHIGPIISCHCAPIAVFVFCGLTIMTIMKRVDKTEMFVC